MGYIKSEAEQQFHADMLSDVYDILKKNKVTAILTNGALLSAYKTGDLFPHAMGALFSTFYNEIKPKQNVLIKQFIKSKFKISKHFKGKNFKIRVKKGKFNIEVVGYTRGEKYYYRQLKNKKKVIPFEFLDPPYTTITLRQKAYRTTQNIEGLLNFLYNDWRAELTSKIAPSQYKTYNHMVIEC